MIPVTQSKPTNGQLDPENVKTRYSGRSFSGAGMFDISDDLWQYNAGADDSAEKMLKPISGLGAIGASNYDGYLRIEYISQLSLFQNRLFCHRLQQFFGLRPAKLRFLKEAVPKTEVLEQPQL